MAPVETKVQASTGVAALSGLVLWALGRYAFKGSVPDVIASWVYVLVPAMLTFTAGYLARHTPRPDLMSTVPAPSASTSITVIPPAVTGAPPGS